MKHAQRKAALRARDLVVVQLHGIDGPAAKFVVLRVRPEYRTQQNAGATSLGMCFHKLCWKDNFSGAFLAVIPSTLQNYYMGPTAEGAGSRDNIAGAYAASSSILMRRDFRNFRS